MAEGWKSAGVGAPERFGQAAHVFVIPRWELRPRVLLDHRRPACCAPRSQRRRPNPLFPMASHKEVEIKFRVDDRRALARRLRAAGFSPVTPRTREQNTLYDLPGRVLQKRGEVLRLRKYGNEWVLTHKAKGKVTRHKTRVETETKIADGEKLERILRSLGYAIAFRYEKFRAQWSDSKGQVVVDETPIGSFGEIEGPGRWIDRTAQLLGIDQNSYITQSYVELFFAWKRRTRSRAREMTFQAVRIAKSSK
jgi:adenylate cyclase class 2